MVGALTFVTPQVPLKSIRILCSFIVDEPICNRNRLARHPRLKLSGNQQELPYPVSWGGNRPPKGGRGQWAVPTVRG